MTFKRGCRYLDLTRMESNRVERGLVGEETAFAQTNLYPCLSEDNPNDWVSECPEDCPYFEHK